MGRGASEASAVQAEKYLRWNFGGGQERRKAEMLRKSLASLLNAKSLDQENVQSALLCHMMFPRHTL